MQSVLLFLTRSKASPALSYGITVAVIGAVCLFRLVVPLDEAPFLLLLPLVFLLSVAFGSGCGLVASLLSAAVAAAFFDHPADVWFTLPQWVALAEYAVVCAAMVLVCSALRQSFRANDAMLAEIGASEGAMRTILDTVSVGIMFAEAPSGRVTRRNRRLDEIVGGPSLAEGSVDAYGEWPAFHGDGTQVQAKDYPLAQILRDNKDRASLQVEFQRPDGQRIWIDLDAAATRDADGQLTGAVVVIADVDARVRAQASLLRLTEELDARRQEAEAAREAAEAANRAKSAFLANMSHELRTPLSAVIGYTELVEEEADDPAVLADLAKIKGNAKHLLSLINDVLDLSKVEANKMELYAEDIALPSFLNEVAATVQTLVAQKNNALTTDFASDLGILRCDAVKLRQCLFNLLGNASKFTEGGRIALRAQREQREGADWLVIAVEDTGIGMSPWQLNRLFQRFSQADESTTRRFGGTGLGLALTRALAGLLGGEVAVTSTEGVGTTFTLAVPYAGPPATAVAANDDTAPVAGEPAPTDFVLVIDDEQSQRDLLARFLRRQRFAVRCAATGQDGLAIARTEQPRAILLDVMMPDIDGWSVLRSLKADERTRDIPVIIVSFVAEPSLGASLGAVDTIKKPVDWMRLRNVLERFRERDGSVLVVDDDSDLRKRIGSVLAKEGWTVREAGDGVQALAAVKSALPDVILLDLNMPVMDGFAFLHQLRAMPDGGAVAVVVLSARDISSSERAELSAAQRVLQKGQVSIRDLAAELREWRIVGERGSGAQ